VAASTRKMALVKSSRFSRSSDSFRWKFLFQCPCA
jgi:hypothetical protein